jgi:antitoxin (DNA-binding transcriptional repressor) of toxin-antitoxin stability system
MKVSIREFNNNVSQFLRRAHAGEIVLVTYRDQPFVVITTPATDRGREQAAGELKKRLEAIPGITWSGLSHHDLTPPAPIKLKGEGPTAADTVLEGRR